MTLNQSRVREHLKNFEFENLFIEELGWDRLRRQPLVISLDADEFTLETIAEKRAWLRSYATQRMFEHAPPIIGSGAKLRIRYDERHTSI